MPQLLDMPPELAHRIVEFLLADSDCDKNEEKTDQRCDVDEAPASLEINDSHVSDGSKDNNSASDGTTSTSVVDDEADSYSTTIETRGAILCLSQTCKYYYTMLGPYLDRWVCLENSDESALNLLYDASRRQGVNVKGMCFCPDEDNKDAGAAVYFLLSHLNVFPNLRSIILNFDLRVVEGEIRDEMCTDVYETEEQMTEAEENHAWRSLQKRTFDAISREDSNNIRELEISTSPIRGNSVFGSQQMNKVFRFLFQ